MVNHRYMYLHTIYGIYTNGVQMNETVEAIKALSRIEGYTMSYEGIKRTSILYDNIDALMEYLNKQLKKETK